MSTPEWRKAACNHHPGCIVITLERGGSYCMVCDLQEQIIRERRDHRQQLVRLAMENADLEKTIIRLESALERTKVKRAWA